jgi:parvulin-like peptidyl-prolyl isomerase
MKLYVRIALAAVTCLLFLGSVMAQDFDLAARVNGEGISRARLQSSVDAYLRQGSMNYGGITQPSQYKRVQRKVLEQLITEELLWQQAAQDGFVTSDVELEQALAAVRQSYPTQMQYENRLTERGFSVESFREDVRRKIAVRKWARATLAKEVEISDAEVHEFYVANEVRFVQSAQINVRHVLIKLAADADADADDATVAAARREIEEILAQARAGADFAELARQRSQGPSAPRGGDLGFVPRGQLVKPFEDAAFALQPGEISEVVRTEFGFHIIKLVARRDGHVVPEQQVAAQIRNHLLEGKLVETVAVHVVALREQASVDILIPL